MATEAERVEWLIDQIEAVGGVVGIAIIGSPCTLLDGRLLVNVNVYLNGDEAEDDEGKTEPADERTW